jgi:hypothetical protein
MLVLNLNNIKQLFTNKSNLVQKYNDGMDQMESLNNMVGNKVVTIAISLFGLLYVTFYALFYVIVGSMFSDNKFLLTVSVLLLIKSAFALYKVIVTVMKDPVKINSLPRYEYINYISEPVELIYIIVFLWMLLS